jgi:hypothetical protein
VTHQPPMAVMICWESQNASKAMLSFLFQNCGWHTCHGRKLNFCLKFGPPFEFKINIQRVQFLSLHIFLELRWQVRILFRRGFFFNSLWGNSWAVLCGVNAEFIAHCLHGCSMIPVCDLWTTQLIPWHCPLQTVNVSVVVLNSV